MTPLQKAAFETLWLNIKNNIHLFKLFVRIQGIIAHHSFQPLNSEIQKTEREQNCSLMSYTLFAFKDNTNELIAHIRILHFISYEFKCLHLTELPLINQICHMDNAPHILENLFSNMVHKELEILRIDSNISPPYINTSDEIFQILIDHYSHISDIHPLFWAIMNEQTQIIIKLLSIKPHWISLNIYQDYTPLMLAVYFRKKASIFTLLKYSQNVYQLNSSQKNLAHLACHSRHANWVIELINDPQFAQLRIADMLFDSPILDRKNKHPIIDAFLKGHFNAVSILLKKAPHLRQSLLFVYEFVEDIHQLELLYDNYQVDIFSEDHVDFLVYLLESVLFNQTHEIMNWYLNHPDMNSNLQNAYKIFQAAYQKDFETVDHLFQNTSIDWHEKPTKIPFMITQLMLEHQQTSLIVKHQLFDLHPHFHHIIDDKNLERTFFNFIDIKKDPHYFKVKHSDFAHYFLNFLERHRMDYPLWGESYHGHLEYILMLFPINKNMHIHGQPLLHFLVSYFYQNYLLNCPWETQLKLIIDESVDLNALDSLGQHLFIKLLSQKNGIQVIQLLKKHFPGFDLHNLDSHGSSLLHLVVENHHMDALTKSLKEYPSLDVCAERSSDHQSPMEIAFSLGHFDMVEQMRKKVKKNQYIDFLKSLIQKKSEAFIDYLLQFIKPFGWELSAHHQSQIKQLPHQEMVKKWTISETKIPSTPKITESRLETQPIAISLTANTLKQMLENSNLKKLELLIGNEYEHTLSQLFENREDFLIFLEMAFKAPQKKIYKTFMRIPVVEERIKTLNPWHALFTKALDSQEKILADNLLHRESIRTTLQIQTPFYLSKIFGQNPSWYDLSWREYFPIELNLLSFVECCLAQSNVGALSQLFKLMTATQIFYLLNPKIILEMMKVPDLIESQFQAFFIYALRNQNIIALIFLQQSALFNKKTGVILSHIQETDLSWLMPIWEQHLTPNDVLDIFKCALRLPYESIALQFLDHPKFLNVLQANARILIELGLKIDAGQWAKPLLSRLPLSLSDTYELFDFVQANRGDYIFVNFVAYTPSTAFLNILKPSDWLDLLENKEITKHFQKYPQRWVPMHKCLADVFTLAVLENKIHIVKWFLTDKSMREKLREEVPCILENALLSQKIPECLHHFQSIAKDNDWHRWFEQALMNEQLLIVEQFLSHESRVKVFQKKSLLFYFTALNHCSSAFSLINSKLKLNPSEQICLFKAILDSSNPSLIEIFQSQFIDLLKLPEIKTHVVEIFFKALLSNQIKICEEILYYPTLRNILYLNAKKIIYLAIEKNCINDLIGLWNIYPADLKRPLHPYIIALRIILPEQISKWMQILKQPDQVCFLVGSTIDTLLKGKSLELLNDFDFVGSALPSKQIMTQSRVQPKLFFSSIPINNKIMKVEYFVNRDAHPHHFIAQDFTQRDFTVNSLYADEHGNVYDPTGYGLADLKKKLIRTISSHPSTCFQEDPIRLIRAMRLLAKDPDFRLEKNTEAAIFSFHATMKINYGHLYAMCNNLFQSPEGLKIFELMNQYHLIVKLLRCNSLESFEQVSSFVKTEAERHKFISVASSKPHGIK